MKMGLFLNFDKSGILENFSRNKAIFTFNVNISWSMESSTSQTPMALELMRDF